ncbi:MAG: alcohol dehydrogenase [Solirubrobacteraceae bacterium]|nr:alcohol dehydrogenase [Solirubrobacteraceae bacterium]
MSVRDFHAPTRIVAGRGCLAERLGDEVARLGVRTVAVIADRGLAEAGVLEPILAHVRDADHELCALIGEDPDLEEAEAAGRAAIERGARGILVIGGGSALCAGKAAAMCLTNPDPLVSYMGRDRLAAPPAPTVAVPTTAGSGSEVSTVVVLHDPNHAQHVVIRGRGYEPEATLLDGDVLRTLPPRPMIAAALDALSHALEALWSTGATRFTDALALASSRAIRTALPRALDGDRDAMQELIEASAMANLACGNAELALVHALSSSPFVHLPHGHQNGVLLPHVAAFNEPALRPEVRAEVAELQPLYDRIGASGTFAAGELSAEGAESMVVAALENPLRGNNVVPAGEAELRGLLAGAGAPVGVR